MRMTNILGGVASSAVIVAMAVVYSTAGEAKSAEPPALGTPAFTITEQDLECLTQNIYWESRGESLTGQAAIAWVTLNRVTSDAFPDTVCAVVWQRHQFGWTSQGQRKLQDTHSLQRARTIALMVVDSYRTGADPTHGSTYFHEVNSRPSWGRKFMKMVRIGQHIFYKTA